MPPHAGQSDSPQIPPWVPRLDMPVWITTPRGVITHMNERAEELIGQPVAHCVGHPCYLIVSGRTPEGGPMCMPQCRVRRLSGASEAMAPIPMKLPLPGGELRDVTLVVIPSSDDQVVHCIVSEARQMKLRGFIDRVAQRSPHETAPEEIHHDLLTSREKEILSLLAQDVSQLEISERLNLSYATVRNHVQHILAKLGVHSILEAIAVSLIEEP